MGPQDYSPHCVYTIASRPKLKSWIDSGGIDQCPIHQRWVAAANALQVADEGGRYFPILFAFAEETRSVVAAGRLNKLEIKGEETIVSFSQLGWLLRPFPKENLILRNGNNLSPDYIKNYVPCRTPSSFHRLSKTHSPQPALRTLFVEGEKKHFVLSMYERNSAARLACIAHYGFECQACGIDFNEKYGLFSSGFIHVHHETPLNGRSRETDPVKDLKPVCPNCHYAIHAIERSMGRLLTVSEFSKRLRKIEKKQRSGRGAVDAAY